MKRFGMVAALALVVGVMVGGPASADDACDSEVVEAAGHYVVVDNLENAHGGIWIYEESNGVEGLQRNDDSCAGEEPADTIIF